MRGGGKATALLGSAADAETAAAHESVQLFGCRVSLSSAGSGGGGGGRAGGAEASEQEVPNVELVVETATTCGASYQYLLPLSWPAWPRDPCSIGRNLRRASIA